MGKYGVREASGIIRAPQSLKIVQGETRKTFAGVSTKGKSVWTNKATFTFCGDHRVIDGAVGGAWFNKFKDYVEHPLKILI